MGVEVLFLLLTGALFLGAFVTGSGSGAADEPDEEDPRVITGTDGDDLLFGNDLDNTIIGLGGDDTIAGGPGRNLILAGDDNDTVLITSEGDTVEGGAGDDLIVSLAAYSLLDGGEGDDTLAGFFGDRLLGGAGDDYLVSQAGQNLMRGGPGNDTLIGGDEDTLIGGEGDDVLISVARGFDAMLRSANVMRGGPGDDLLISNGQDTLTGGSGADTFRFVDWIGEEPFNTWGTATITDFDPLRDVIEIAVPEGRPAPVLSKLPSPANNLVTLFADDVAIVTIVGQTNLDLTRIVFVPEAEALPPLPSPAPV